MEYQSFIAAGIYFEKVNFEKWSKENQKKKN